GTRFTRLTIAFVALALILFICQYAYTVKKVSAESRLLVWKVALQLFSDRPATGYGYGTFEKYYNLHQAAYFQTGSASEKEIKNASYVRTGYNEFFENCVEGGIVGVTLFTAIAVLLLFDAYCTLKKSPDDFYKIGASAG